MRLILRTLAGLFVAAVFAFNLAAFVVAGSWLNLCAAVALAITLPVTYWLGRRSVGRRSR